MNKLNTMLGQLLALVSRSRFEKLVQEHNVPAVYDVFAARIRACAASLP
jgi:hypothetical protein